MSSRFRPDMDTIRNIPIYSVGNRVLVRDQEQMIRYYGETQGDISTPILFTDRMTETCGEYATVISIRLESIFWKGEMVDFQRIRMKFDNPELDKFDDHYSWMNWFVEPIHRQQKKGLKKSLKNTIEGTGKFNERLI